MTTATSTPTVYSRVMVCAMRHDVAFTVMHILREVNAQHELAPLTIQQVLKELGRMVNHGLIERRALGKFEWKD